MHGVQISLSRAVLRKVYLSDMRKNAETYYQKARQFAVKAAESSNPVTIKSYSKLASDYVRLARHASEADRQVSLVERMVGWSR